MPAPRGGSDQAMLETAEELRALLREARGVLGDLVRERKAVEQLARERAEKVIESHVNACIDELTRHVNREMPIYGAQIRNYFQGVLDHYLNPGRYDHPGAPSVPEVLDAVAIIGRAKKVLNLNAEGETGGG